MKTQEDHLALRLQKLLAHEDAAGLRAIAGDRYAQDVAEALGQLRVEDRLAVLDALTAEQAAEVVSHLAPSAMREVIDRLPDAYVATVAEHMRPDNAADMLEELPIDRQQAILAHIPNVDRLEDLRSLLKFGPHTAGGLMSTEVLTLSPDWSVDQAIAHLRGRAAEKPETIYNLYVVDGEDRLVGVAGLRALVLAPAGAFVREVMEPEVIAACVDDPEDEVVETIARYDLLALPVVDHADRLVGVVTVDDVIDVIQEETTRDFFSSGGVNPEAEPAEMVRGSVRAGLQARLPWLLVTLLGGLLAGVVVGQFTDRIEQMAAAATFMPVVMGLGGSVGIQSVTITVRSLALGTLEKGSGVRVAWREVRLGAALGVILALGLTLAAGLWMHDFRLAGVIGLALLTNVTAAALMGIVIPIGMKLLRIDPAVASGPFITTAIDVTGLTIYFGLIWLLA